MKSPKKGIFAIVITLALGLVFVSSAVALAATENLFSKTFEDLKKFQQNPEYISQTVIVSAFSREDEVRGGKQSQEIATSDRGRIRDDKKNIIVAVPIGGGVVSIIEEKPFYKNIIGTVTKTSSVIASATKQSYKNVINSLPEIKFPEISLPKIEIPKIEIAANMQHVGRSVKEETASVFDSVKNFFSNIFEKQSPDVSPIVAQPAPSSPSQPSLSSSPSPLAPAPTQAVVQPTVINQVSQKELQVIREKVIVDNSALLLLSKQIELMNAENEKYKTSQQKLISELSQVSNVGPRGSVAYTIGNPTFTGTAQGLEDDDIPDDITVSTSKNLSAGNITASGNITAGGVVIDQSGQITGTTGATFSDKIKIGPGTIIIDGINNYITSPSNALSIYTTSTPLAVSALTATGTWSSYFTGNFGIGTTTPGSGLSVQATSTLLGGPTYIYGQLTLPNFFATSTTATSTFDGGVILARSAGNVGIGTSTPASHTLSVAGNLLIGGTATSTFENGIKLTSGCFLLPNGSCAGGTSLANITESGSNTGISSTSPGSALEVGGFTVIKGNLNVEATSTVSSLIATSTLSVGTSTPTNNNQLAVQGNTYITQGLGIGAATTSAGGLFVKGSVDIYDGLIVRGGKILGPDGTASEPGYSFQADTNTGAFRAGADALAFSTGGSERARILSTGEFLVGGTAVVSGEQMLLRKDQNGQTFFRVHNATSGTAAESLVGVSVTGAAAYLGATTASFTPTTGIQALEAYLSNSGGTEALAIATRGAAPIRIVTGQTERARFLSTGEFGIGKTGPTTALDVVGTTTTSGVSILSRQLYIGNGITATSSIYGQYGNLGFASTVPYGQVSIESDEDVVGSTTPIFVIGDQGTSSPLLYVSGVNGNVGVATDSPAQPFSVDSNAYIGSLGVGSATTSAGGLFVKGSVDIYDGLVVRGGRLLVGATSPTSDEIALVRKDQNAATRLLVQNETAGTAAFGQLQIRAGGASPVAALLNAYSASYTTSGIDVAGALSLSNGGGAGETQINIGTRTAIPLTFWANNAEQGRFLSTGEFLIGRTTLLGSGGIVNFEKNQNAATEVTVHNDTSGTAARSILRVDSNSASIVGQFQVLSAGWTTSGEAIAGEMQLVASGASLTGMNLRVATADPMRFSTNNTERARFLSTGEFGIGRTSPSVALDVVGTTTVSSGINILGRQFYIGNGITATSSIFGQYGNLGFASSVPYGQFSIEADEDVVGSTSPIFVIGDQGTSTPFLIVSGNDGAVGIATTTNYGAESSTGAGLSVATSTYIQGGLGVGVATTSAGGLFVKGSADIYDGLVVRGGRLLVGATSPTSDEIALVRKDQNAATPVLVENRTDGTAAQSQILIAAGGQNGTGSVPGGAIAVYSPSFTTSGLNIADSVRINANSLTSGGLILDTTAAAPIIFGTGNAERARIASTGELFLGNTAAIGFEDFLVQKNQNDTSGINVENTTDGTAAAAGYRAGASGSTLNIFALATSYTTSNILVPGAVVFYGSGSVTQVNLGASTAVPLTFWTNNAERARFTSTGEFGIARTNPSVALDVVGTTTVSSGISILGRQFYIGNGLVATSSIYGQYGNLGFASTVPYGQVSIEADEDVVGSSTPIFVIGDQGTATPFIYVSGNNGNVGVATDSPATSLSVDGSLLVSGTTTVQEIKFLESDIASSTPNRNTLYADNIVKGWIHFDGKTGAAATIRDHFNASSVTRNAAGDYTVTWNQAFATRGYVVSGTCEQRVAAASCVIIPNPDFTLPAQAPGSIRFYTTNLAGTPTDAEGVAIMAIGQQ